MPRDDPAAYLAGRRKRMKPGEMKKKHAEMMEEGEKAHAMIVPGTRAFGQRAAARKERLERRRKGGDLRVSTAHGTVKASTAAKRKMMEDE